MSHTVHEENYEYPRCPVCYHSMEEHLMFVEYYRHREPHAVVNGLLAEFIKCIRYSREDTTLCWCLYYVDNISEEG